MTAPLTALELAQLNDSRSKCKKFKKGSDEWYALHLCVVLFYNTKRTAELYLCSDVHIWQCTGRWSCQSCNHDTYVLITCRGRSMSYVGTDQAMMLGSTALGIHDRLVRRAPARAATELPAVVLEVGLLTAL